MFPFVGETSGVFMEFDYSTGKISLLASSIGNAEMPCLNFVKNNESSFTLLLSGAEVKVY